MHQLTKWLPCVIGLVLFTGCGGQSTDGESAVEPQQSNRVEFSECVYDSTVPGHENNVKVAGGATCAEAKDLFVIGPALSDLRPHRAADIAREPAVDDDWVCQADQPGSTAPLHVECTAGQKLATYVFH